MNKKEARLKLNVLLQLAALTQGWQDVNILKGKYRGTYQVLTRAAFTLAACELIGRDTEALNLIARAIRRKRSNLYHYFKLAETSNYILLLSQKILKDYGKNK